MFSCCNLNLQFKPGWKTNHYNQVYIACHDKAEMFGGIKSGTKVKIFKIPLPVRLK
jgi:hypothetical protein